MDITRPSFDEKEIESLRACLSSGWVTQAPMTATFETAFAQRHEAQFALATCSSTGSWGRGLRRRWYVLRCVQPYHWRIALLLLTPTPGRSPARRGHGHHE